MIIDPIDLLVITFVGWPAILTSALVWIYGLITKKYKFILAAGILILPFSIFYFGAGINSYFLGAFFSSGHFGSAFATYKNKTWVARLLILPFLYIISRMAYAVLTQDI